ncbi:MAG TPA: Spy/CpxP family protein refolding chaperone, partial [Steroidobacteraceae bacterium]|nr:Spy/CpxP family protein refolding chaperone [Steroidobacteraceae bacterium]
QKAQVKDIFTKAHAQMQAFGERARANHEKLLVTPPTDAAYAGLLANAKKDAVEAIQHMSDVWTKIYAVLTPEQRAKVPEIIAAEKAKMEAYRQGMKGHQPSPPPPPPPASK